MIDQPTEAVEPANTEAPPKETSNCPADTPGCVERLIASVFGLYKSHRFNRRVADIDFEATVTTWNKELKTESSRRDRADAISRAYSGAFDRGVRLEAKAVGYLQVLAIAFAIVTLGIVRDSIAVRSVLVLSLVFLTIAVLGTVAVLQPGARRQALVSDVTSPTNGMAEAAVAAADMDRRHIRSANFLAGAKHDLLVGGALAVVSLILIASGFGDESGTVTTNQSSRRDDFTRAISAATVAHEGDATAIGYEVTRRGFAVEIVLNDGRVLNVALNDDFELVRQREDIDDRVDTDTAATLGATDLRAAHDAVRDEIGDDGIVTGIELDRGGYEAEVRRSDGTELDIDLDDQATVTDVQADD